MTPYPNMTCFAFETITVSSTALPFTVATYSGDPANPPTFVIATVATDSIRYRADSIAPTASIGHLVPAGVSFEVRGTQAIRDFKMIRVTTDSTVTVSYYREGP